MSTKDPFEILADEITLIRQDMARLQRTSLDRDEAALLHETVVESLNQMLKVGEQVQTAIDRRLTAVATTIRQDALRAAVSAAEGAIEKSHAENLKAARSFSEAAGEARKEAWRHFGGFWVWLASVGALGALLGLGTAFWMTGRGDAREFGKYPSIYCGAAGGQVVEQPDGSAFCAFWIKTPPKKGG